MMEQEKNRSIHGLSWEDEEKQLASTIGIAQKNLEQAERYTEQLSEELHEMLETYEAKDKETLALWHNILTVTGKQERLDSMSEG